MRRIAFVVYPGFELLDVSGPAAVFSSATELGVGNYRVACVSPHGGPVAAGNGMVITTSSIRSLRVCGDDTVLAAGANEEALRVAARMASIAAVLRRAARRAERVGSICTGAFLLAAAGVLRGRRATTHWAACTALARHHPDIRLEPDALYVDDEGVWTSAGVTTGIDMALAMLRRDHGAAAMGEVARRLIVYAHRPGSQSQWSTLLSAQVDATPDLADVVEYVESRPGARLDVTSLARRAGMSERTFHRRFVEVLGATPGEWVATRRIEHARRLLEAGQDVKVVASAVGFASESAFRSAFRKRAGVPPATYGALHETGATRPASFRSGP